MDGNGGEALVVCSEKNMGTGIKVWDITTGDHILHIPTCASHSHGLLCLRKYNNQFLVASQIHRHGSVGGGVIFMWPLNKPQTPLRSYTFEAIGPLSCTKDGAYLSGGALSGNAYIWEVASGKLLKTWRAHYRSLTCMLFSDDGSLLISGSGDGMICVWSMISLLDVNDLGISLSLLRCSSNHTSSITGLSTTSGSSNPSLLSTSLDGTLKVSDLVLGGVIQTLVHPIGVTASVLHPSERAMFCGGIDGKIFINKLDFGLIDEDSIEDDDQPIVLKGHNGAITALAFSRAGLVSASEDCTVCVWDEVHWTIARRFEHKKGAVTNLAVIRRSSLPSSSTKNNRKISNTFRILPLGKHPHPARSSSNETITLLPLSQSSIELRISADHSSQQKEWTLEAKQMRVETSIEKRIWAMNMTKQVMEMNRNLQSLLLDFMKRRLLGSKVRETNSTNTNTTKKRKKYHG